MNVFRARMMTSLLCCSFMLSGCSTLINGTSQDILVSTNPPGAVVSDGTVSSTTPCTLKLHRGETYMLTISKVGYESKTILMKQRISKWVIGDLLLGVIGIGVDAVTGALWYHTPENISVELIPISENHGKETAVKHETLEGKLEELERLKQKNVVTEEEYNSMKTIIFRSFGMEKTA